MRVKPFLKWAGGKSKLLLEIRKRYPVEMWTNYDFRYVELFLGGGAVLLDVLQEFPWLPHVGGVWVNDKSLELILAWLLVKRRVHDLIAYLEELQAVYWAKDLVAREEMYYELRLRFNEVRKGADLSVQADFDRWLELVGLMLFLNKTCFNGLWRVNKKGEFNVSHGKYKRPKIVDSDNLKLVSALIQNVHFIWGDFENMLGLDVGNPVFVYADPPYKPKSEGGFVSYSGRFDDDEQQRLAAFLINFKGSAYRPYVLISNSYFPEYFEALYPEFVIDTVETSHNINFKRGAANFVKELLIRNYDV